MKVSYISNWISKMHFAYSTLKTKLNIRLKGLRLSKVTEVRKTITIQHLKMGNLHIFDICVLHRQVIHVLPQDDSASANQS